MQLVTLSLASDGCQQTATEETSAVRLRCLAARGELHRTVTQAPPLALAQLRSAAFGIALPLVWERHTRPLEIRKGHRRCRSAISQLTPDCLDGFTDDLEAVVSGLMSYRRPIGNLEGWLIQRMANAIKDGNRIRRARVMGAQQRVRVPAQVTAELGGNPWLTSLAGRVLQWAGVQSTAGTGLWPLGAWAEERARITGEWDAMAGQSRVASELKMVLDTMRRCDPVWYERYVERPLGRKWAPVAYDPDPANGTDRRGADADSVWLELVPRGERDDAHLLELAATSLGLIQAGIAAGRQLMDVVPEALAKAFLGPRSVCSEIDERPLIGGHDTLCAVAAILADPAALARITAAAADILGLDRAAAVTA
jgi:hypothetical protein